jgi:hypothetical protein
MQGSPIHGLKPKNVHITTLLSIAHIKIINQMKQVFLETLTVTQLVKEIPGIL